MGAKPRPKASTSGSDDTKPDTKKRHWLLRIGRKRKYKSASVERLYDTDLNFKTSEEPGEVTMENARDGHHECSMPDDIVVEPVLEDEIDHTGEGVKGNHNTRANGEKKKLFGSAMKFFKKSFKSSKQRKQNNYSKFSESTDHLVESNTSTSKDQHPDMDLSNESKVDTPDSVSKEEKAKGRKREKSKNYVRFETNDNENKENMAMTIDEEEHIDHLESTSTPTMTKKKKKSARKRVAKAGRQTGRMFGVGMVQIGRNLQYLSPIPTAHVFAETGSKASNYGASKPKKQSYKYTASAPPANPYAFI